MNILLGLLTSLLVLVSLFLIMVVLMQKAKSDGGLGSAMGGGMTEATFGAETSNVLTKATIRAAIVFFVLCIALFLARIYQRGHPGGHGPLLPTIPGAMNPSAVPFGTQKPATSPNPAPTVPAGGAAKP